MSFGSFTRPPQETGGAARLESLLGYLVVHPAGNLLFDTGMAFADDETEDWYRPRRIAPGRRAGRRGRSTGRDRDGRQLPPPPRPLRRQSGLRRPARRLPATRARRRTLDRGLHASRAGGPRRRDLSRDRWAGRDPARRQGLADPGPHGRPPGAGGSPGRWIGRPGCPEPPDGCGVRRRGARSGGWLRGLLALDPRRVLFAHDGSAWEP